MFVISSSGFEEITENCREKTMDISLSNRGKLPIDCLYTVSENPNHYKITEEGIEKKSDDELLSEGLITNEEWKEKKNSEVMERRKEKYQSRSDCLYMEYLYDKSETKKKEWTAEVAKIKSEEPKV